MPNRLLIAQTGKTHCRCCPHLPTGHGLIAGATGTGKTSPATHAQELSRSGVPVFMADVKGAPRRLAQAGAMTAKLSNG